MSAYQADWFVDEEGGTHFEDDGGGDGDNADGHGNAERIKSDGGAKNRDADSDVGSEDDHEALDALDDLDTSSAKMMTGDNTNRSATMINMKHDTGTKSVAEIRRLQLLQQERSDAEFPDEVDTPEDIPARSRFSRYRALQSFRSSLWHPKENLPRDYAQIFQFENFGTAQRR